MWIIKIDSQCLKEMELYAYLGKNNSKNIRRPWWYYQQWTTDRDWGVAYGKQGTV